MVQYGGICAIGHRTDLRNRVAQFDHWTGHDSEQHVAVKNDAAGRYAEYGDSGNGEQRFQYRAVFRCGHDPLFGSGCQSGNSVWAGDFCRSDAVVSVYGAVQVLTGLGRMTSHWRRMVGAGMVLAMIAPAWAQNPPKVSSASGQNSQQGSFTLKVNAELVLTNVVARDAKTGEVVRGLKQSDFSVYENGKQQQISSFDFQSVDMATPLNRSEE